MAKKATPALPGMPTTAVPLISPGADLSGLGATRRPGASRYTDSGIVYDDAVGMDPKAAAQLRLTKAMIAASAASYTGGRAGDDETFFDRLSRAEKKDLFDEMERAQKDAMGRWIKKMRRLKPLGWDRGL